MTKELSGVVATHIRAVNAFDTDAIVATFAHDAYVNYNRREIVGIEAIRRWVEKVLSKGSRVATLPRVPRKVRNSRRCKGCHLK
jgi:hypothetical protein